MAPPYLSTPSRCFPAVLATNHAELVVIILFIPRGTSCYPTYSHVLDHPMCVHCLVTSYCRSLRPYIFGLLQTASWQFHCDSSIECCLLLHHNPMRHGMPLCEVVARQCDFLQYSQSVIVIRDSASEMIVSQPALHTTTSTLSMSHPVIGCHSSSSNTIH